MLRKIILIISFSLLMSIGIASAKTTLPGAKITEDQAKQIAMNTVTGKVVKIELEIENEVLVYEVDIQTPNMVYEVKVCAKTGKVLEVEKEDDKVKQKRK
ncbi:MAG: peptidase, partial [Bacillales bacterium]|nr:peptidase [Bacillales bacterium]